MFEDPVALPDIHLRPDSSARGSRVSSLTSVLKRTNLGRATSATKRDFPISPSEALERFRRNLTTFEQTEIAKYQQVYFVGPLARKINAAEGKGPNFGYDDDKGRYKCVKSDHIAYRFEILKGLGKGSFGDVVKTFDHKTKKHQAVKIIRNERR